MKPGSSPNNFALIQEEAGIHVGISATLALAGRHAAQVLQEQFDDWRDRGRYRAWGHYKRSYFAIAVGGGNTIKSQYHAWLNYHHNSIDWLRFVRFYFLEETTGEPGWESAEQSLIMNFIVPLAEKLRKQRGTKVLARSLELSADSDLDDIIDAMITTLVHPINLAPAKQALDSGKSRRAIQLAKQESLRYQQDIQSKLGVSMAFHCIVSGIGKDGTIGALAPHMPELADRESGTLLLKRDGGAIRVALNRGVLINAERISLIVSGSLKLKALGRFEMEESADFEQTVMETPLRLLRESPDVAEKVYIFADEQSLHFDETIFEFSERGQIVQNKAETRAGDEENGVHILLMHGFMGLFSFANLLIRLPSSWTVSALHRGSRAKFMDSDEIFPHYARALRKAILSNWRKGRAVPIAGHSIAGVISDHLLLSVLSDYDADIPAYEKLKAEDRQLIDALRASGIIHLATWSPCDGPNTGENVRSLVSHVRHDTALDYSGFERIYKLDENGKLGPAHPSDLAESASTLTGLDRFLKRRISRPFINGMTVGLRKMLEQRPVQQRMLNADMPYVLRLVGGRLLKTASLYGLAKEINAGLHSPVEYQRRHLKALDILLAYDIPFLSIIHQDDFLVSAGRHAEEHEYLVAQRLKREGVNSEEALEIPARLVILQRAQDELPLDPLNPHLLVMSTNREGNKMARQITAAMTEFVNENVARAIHKKNLRPLPSITRWQRKKKLPRAKTQVA
jgi:6-phosphogluconolactonase/glucosamine-6-phosphate isomerase/deaminase